MTAGWRRKREGPGGWATVRDVSSLLEAFVSLPTIVMVKRSVQILKRFHWLNSVKSIRDSLSRGGMKAEEDIPRCLARVPEEVGSVGISLGEMGFVYVMICL